MVNNSMSLRGENHDSALGKRRQKLKPLPPEKKQLKPLPPEKKQLKPLPPKKTDILGDSAPAPDQVRDVASYSTSNPEGPSLISQLGIPHKSENKLDHWGKSAADDLQIVKDWGSLDSEEIHRMLTEKGYEFKVSENSVLIKNQASNLAEV